MQKNGWQGWQFTLALAGLAIGAGLLAPQMQTPPPEPVVEAEADVCLRLGPYECCYKEDE